MDRTLADSVAAVGTPAGRIADGPLAYLRGVSAWLADVAPAVVAVEREPVEPGDLVVAGLLSLDDAAALRDSRGCPPVFASLAPLCPTAAGSSCLAPVRPGWSRLNRWAGPLSLAATASMCTTTGRLLRGRLGIGPSSARDFARLVRTVPTLLAVSPTVTPRPADWPDHVYQTGFWFDAAASAAGGEGLAVPGWQPPADLVDFRAAGPAPVFLGFGSVPGADPAAGLRLLTAAAELAGRRVVIGLPGGGPAHCPPPAGVHLLRDEPGVTAAASHLIRLLG